MNEFLRKRIERKLETLPEDRVYQVLDYIEFLESRYATKSAEAPSPLQKLAETVEDTLRVGKVSVSAIRGTMDVMSTAGRVMSGLAAAGKSVVDQVAGGRPAHGEIRQKVEPPKDEPSKEEPSKEEPPKEEPPREPPPSA